jgi:Cu/Zn superoxide dismutase
MQQRRQTRWTVAVLSTLLVLALMPSVAAQETTPPVGSEAWVRLIDADGAPAGLVVLEDVGDAVFVSVRASGLRPGFHGFHVHAGARCTDDSGEPDFALAEGHFGHDEDTHHGQHPGDLPSLYADADGEAELSFATDRFTLQEIVGRTIIVHADPDNFANIPDRYRSTSGSGPDEETRLTGDSGDRVACGEVAPAAPAALDPTRSPEVGRAYVELLDSDLEPIGVAEVAGFADGRTRVSAVIDEGLTGSFHGFHVHSGERCVDDEGNADFSEAGGHLGHEDLGGDIHGDHTGDLVPLLALGDGSAYLSFVTDRFVPADVMGRAMIVHAGPDNFAHIPPRYLSTSPQDGPAPPGPDRTTQATGDSGDRLACGVLEPDAMSVRLDGANRYDTAVSVSGSGFPEAQSAPAAVLARGDVFADGLAGTPLAGAVDGPLLLTQPNALPQVVADELSRVLAEDATVHLLGGERAIGDGVREAVEALGFATERIAGANRYETAVAIAEELDPDVILLATGVRFPDALAAGAAAATSGGAVLLTAGDEPHPATDAYLEETGDADTHAIGGPAAAAYPDAEAHVGANRYETAAEVARAFFDDDVDLAAGLARGGSAGDATDQAFADALTGGAHAARLGSPILLTPSTALHPTTAQVLCDLSLRVGTVYGYGGPTALANRVLDAAADAAAGLGCPTS